MSKRYFPIIIALLAFFGSCSKDDVASSGGNNGEPQDKGLTCTVTPIENGDAESRSSLTLGSSGMDFAWTEGDKLSVFYSEADQTAGIYTLNRFNNESKTSANFKSVGFMLQNGERYYAISTTEHDGVRIPDKRNIELSYAGQTQKGNKTTAHLGAYDYMAASGIADGDDHVTFNFVHIGVTLRVIMEGLPADVRFTKMEMYDTENSYLQPTRTLDLTKGLAADGTYTPALNPVDMSSAEYKTSERFSLTLHDATDNTKGVKADINVADNKGRLEMFIEVPPVDLTGKDIVFMVNGSNGKAYYIRCTGKNLAAGKAYQMKGAAQEADTYNVKIKVNHAWQHGSTLDSRAATGDPGVDEKFPKPKNLYYVLCVNGKVKAIAPAHSSQSTSVAPVNEIENISDGSWAESADKTISTYAGELTFNFDSDEMSQTKNVYIVASNNDLTSLFSGITTTTTETQIQNLVYSIQEEALVGTDYTSQDKTQAFMKNLYSTPWTEADFVGNLGADYFKDIILYHVAAKVDLQWNSTLILSGNVSVNNVANESLSLFQPATKNGTTGFIDNDASNNYTVTSPIEADRMYNGRQVFYLPQFNTYNVKVGGNAATDITFSPSTANGWTSWLRWLKKY